MRTCRGRGRFTEVFSAQSVFSRGIMIGFWRKRLENKLEDLMRRSIMWMNLKEYENNVLTIGK